MSDERALKSKEKGARTSQRLGKIECCEAIKTSSGAMFENNLFSDEREVNGKTGSRSSSEVVSMNSRLRPLQTPHHRLCGEELDRRLVFLEWNPLRDAHHAFAQLSHEYHACPISVSVSGPTV